MVSCARSQVPAQPPATPVRPRGGSVRSAVLTGGFVALFATGLAIWLDALPGGGIEALVLTHLWAGLAFVIMLLSWLVPHVPHGLAHAGRRWFRWLAWLLLAKYVLVLVTGLVMAWPALLWMAGSVWFPDRSATTVLSLLHFWGSWAALAGLLVHLIMRHWQAPGPVKDKR